MRMTTRVSTGLFLMAGLLIASLTYQLSQVESLQRINRRVTGTNIEGARISLGLLQALDGVREFSAKYQVLPDSAYWAQWMEWEGAAEEDLRFLASVDLGARENQVRARIDEVWSHYREITDDRRGPGNPPAFDQRQAARMQAVLGRIRADVENLITVNEATVVQESLSSARASGYARRIAWLTAGSALLIAALLSLLLYRWISDPLHRLTRGTREVARGRFDHRLSVQGPTELSALAADFNRMAERLDEVDNLKKDFISHVSHELKSPLAAVQETIEVLLDELAGPLTEKQARLLELSRSSSLRLSSMIRDLLQISSLEAGAVRCAPSRTDAGLIVRGAVDESELLAMDRDVNIHFEQSAESAELICDPDRIRELVTNLLGNALKFSPPGSAVHVTLTDVESSPHGVPGDRDDVEEVSTPALLLAVEDEGPGVPDEEKARIFEKFYQVRQGSGGGRQGVGLGLAICQRIVDMHQGAIWVEDREPNGSAFRVVLPRVPSRWAKQGSFEPDAATHAAGPPRKSTPSRLRASHRAALGVLMVLGAAACSAGRPEIDRPAARGPVDGMLLSPVSLTESALAARLDTAWSLVATGRHEDAYREFEAVSELAEGDGPAGDALWGMALLHLLPDGPLFDPERAGTLLDHLRSEYAHDALGVQAAWVQGLLADLAEVRVMVEDQEAALRQLVETMEKLKDIDLNRAPRRPPPRPGR